MIEIPVIPIPEVVFFPKTVLPLRIEEPSYQLLVRDAIKSHKEIAVAMARRSDQLAIYNGRRLSLFIPAPICSIGHPVIVEEDHYGIKVLIKGTQRVQLLNLISNHKYPIFLAKIIHDDQQVFGRSFGHIQQIANMLEEWVAITVEDSLEREVFYNSLHTTSHIINYSAMLMIGDRDVRQLLLECDSNLERVNYLFLLLHGRSPLEENPRVSSAIKRFEIIEKIAAGQ